MHIEGTLEICLFILRFQTLIKKLLIAFHNKICWMLLLQNMKKWKSQIKIFIHKHPVLLDIQNNASLAITWLQSTYKCVSVQPLKTV